MHVGGVGVFVDFRLFLRYAPHWAVGVLYVVSLPSFQLFIGSSIHQLQATSTHILFSTHSYLLVDMSSFRTFHDWLAVKTRHEK